MCGVGSWLLQDVCSLFMGLCCRCLLFVVIFVSVAIVVCCLDIVVCCNSFWAFGV